MAATTGNSQPEMDLFMAKAQVAMAMIFMFGIFGLVFMLILWHDTMTAVAQTIITSIIAALVTVLTLQQNFFFARQRPQSNSPPAQPTLTGVFNANAPTPSPTSSPPGPPGVGSGAV
jgi:hypothetical protein